LRSPNIGGIAAFIDVKHSFDRNYMKELGVDIEYQLYHNLLDDEALEVSDNLIRSGAIDVLCH
jgi:RecA/RadA recombinase